MFLNLKVTDKTWTFRGLQAAFCTAIDIEIKENVSKLTLRFCKGKTMKNLKFNFFNFPVILLGKFLHLRVKSCLMMDLAKLKADFKNRSIFLISLISQVSKLKNDQNAKISIFSWSYTFLCMTSEQFIKSNYLKNPDVSDKSVRNFLH